MFLFDKKSSFLLLIFFIPLLFLPKINLISFSEETAGIRYDDLLLFFLACTITWAHFSLNKTISKTERFILAILATSLLSYFLNLLFVHLDLIQAKARLPYAVRLFEYFMFFYLGIMLTHFMRTKTLLMAFLLWNVFIMFLQKFEVIGGMMYGIYEPITSWRVVGIASFPTELGILLNMLYCYFAFSPEKAYLNRIPKHLRKIAKRTEVYITFALFAFLISLTGSRIPIICLIFCFLCKLLQEFRTYSRNIRGPAFVFGGILLIVIGLSLTLNHTIYERTAAIFSKGNINIIDNIWQHVDVTQLPVADEGAREIAENQADLSWWIRLHRWSYALKVYIQNPECWLLGVGPGFASAALDGGWLRLLTENGIVGLFLYAGLFHTLSRQSKQLFWMIIAISINMLFSDVYLAYKPMCLLFLTYGMSQVPLTETPFRAYTPAKISST